RADAVRATHPRASGPRRVRDGHPRQLSASVPGSAAGRVRGAGSGDGALALAVAGARAPPVPHSRRFPPVEHPVPQGHRLQRARPEPGRMGRARRRRGRTRDQLPLLRHAQGRATGSARDGRALPPPLPRVPRYLHPCQWRPRAARDLAAVSRLPRARAAAPALVSRPARHHALRSRAPGGIADAPHPVRHGRRVVAVRGGPMSWAIWITGLPGSGKSTVARAAVAELTAAGSAVVLLELDRMRAAVTPQPTYGAAEREIVYRSLVFAAHTLTEAGVPVIIDATGHRRAWRDLARASVARFAEVQLDCPLDVACAREAARGPGAAPRAIYAGAAAPGATVPGVNVPYERALTPELTIDASAEDAEAAGARIAALGLTLGPVTRQPEAAGGAVVWITGPPGSGKTTLAARTAERLAADG